MVKDVAALMAIATTSKDDDAAMAKPSTAVPASHKLAAYSLAFYVECILLNMHFFQLVSI